MKTAAILEQHIYKWWWEKMQERNFEYIFDNEISERKWAKYKVSKK